MSSFVNTSFFSQPVLDAHGDGEEAEEVDELPRLLKQTLARCEALARENAALLADKTRTEDKLAVLQKIMGEDVSGGVDSSILDASIATLRGKLLEESRNENQVLREHVVEWQAKHALAEQNLALEKRANVQAVQRSARAVKELKDCEALSTARAHAVDRLDAELVQCKRDLAQVDAAALSAKQQAARAEHELDQIKQTLERERAENAELKSRLLTQGLDIRVLQADFPSQPPKQLLVSKREEEDDQAQQQRLKRRVADLEEDNIRLRQQNGGSGEQQQQLRESLAGVIQELKLCNAEHAEERAKLTGQIAALEAKSQALERQLGKIVRKCHEYKFLAKKAQAELAAFVARRLYNDAAV